MNITELTKALHAKINTTTSTQEVLALSKAIEQLNIGSVRTVSTYTALADLFTLDGEVIFVEDENALYYSFMGLWSKIDAPTILRTWSWGYGNQGQLATNGSGSQTSPVSIVGGFTDWIEISAGGVHSVGLRSNGTAWAWGSNDSRRLGDGTITTRSSPVSVIGGFTDWIQLSAGGKATNTPGHSIGIRSNGSVWGWGSGSAGQLGDSTGAYSQSSPVSVVGGFADWIHVGAGGSHSAGLRENGTIWTWGGNAVGQLGDGTTVSKSSPVSIVGGFTDWEQLSVGIYHNVALRSNGTAWSWGANAGGSFGSVGRGRLGDNTFIDKSSPVSVVGGFTDWVEVKAGYAHTLGIRSNGTAWAWGGNSFYQGGYTYTGQLGDGSASNRSSPVSVVGGFTDWIQLDAGSEHSIGLRANGTVWAWGSGTQGKLGTGTLTARSSPVSVIGGFTNWIQITAGISHNHAIRSS